MSQLLGTLGEMAAPLAGVLGVCAVAPVAVMMAGGRLVGRLLGDGGGGHSVGGSGVPLAQSVFT